VCEVIAWHENIQTIATLLKKIQSSATPEHSKIATPDPGERLRLTVKRMRRL
jgi:hypothetical protein